METSLRGGQARRGATALGNGLLTLASIGGAICILLVLLAVFFHITLIMFKTGSMSPTIPTGSLAVVREIPASEAKIGDVVTVDRAGALPITHRVIASAQVGGGLTSLTLRGDANPTADPAPYLVSTVRLVVFAVPQLAYAVAAVSNPFALGVITLGAAGIVTWAFWPRETVRPTRTKRRPTHDRSRMRHAGVASAIVLLLCAGAVLLPGQRAQAAVTEDTIVGTAITLVSIGDKDAMRDLKPGDDVTWQVGVQPHPAEPGVVDISLVASGGLMSDPSGLWVTVRTCDVRWAGGVCSSGETDVMGPAAASAALSSTLRIATAMPTSQQLWVLVDAFVPSNPTVAAAGFANLSIVAAGTGGTVVAGSSAGTTAYTGVNLERPLQVAIGAIAIGLAFAFFGGLRRRAVAA